MHEQLIYVLQKCIQLFFKDEDVDRTESDTLNGFPAKKLTLQPGGCGFYEFPIQPGEINAYVQPAKKEGDVYWVRV